jgi:hypothetical protein
VDHYIEIRYEDLVEEAEPALRRVCDFAELDFDPAMERYHERAEGRMAEVTRDFQIGGGPLLSAGDRARQHRLVSEPPRKDRLARWRTDMPEADQKTFGRVAGDLLAELGYPPA